MTCPVQQSAGSGQLTAPAPSSAAVSWPDGDDIADRFERFAGTVYIAFFAAGLFDQAMLPEVSAALENTGRIRNAPWGRALRTAASDQIAFSGQDADRRAEMRRLKELHRDVKGVGANGVRYSALMPESWNWILISTFFVHSGAFVAVTGHRLSPAEDQAIWDRYRQLTEELQLPGRSRLVESYPELCAYYDRMVAEKLATTATLENATDIVLRPPLPDFLPVAATPLWKLVGPVAGHVGYVLGFGIMHPGVRALTPVRWSRRHDLEFAVLTRSLRLANRLVPEAITQTPLTRNRRRYAQLMKQYRGIGLTSFAADKVAASR
ncbi:oxygenase MpaB family protein [Nocardia iowensis]|uniref:DUF2236 domain-containing protein n=1 Tax=Nocardia iowensis TaxID=204891 RepID=A0ABX8RKS8_NOCIO|nr:oxygenase MpaB family protein [Nocardia iowensis]QXN88051.1 DUF2236 domain-containing protein [Nocardia iowensis]